ncbi:MAG TPA: 16S rRNA (guanine(527)-N(7))-methyltransferase RsmG [Pyrinomonadaceae bacterium]|nr:16S rRNA (guanine(527)-N(7))-methyltransferase RsmG [Pyrinomonadaceae bacterium]
MTDKSRVTEFTNTLVSDAADYGVEITPDSFDRLAAYYMLLDSWNPRLHLVAPCSPREFARRHVLESLVLLPHLPRDARVADIGSGAGLPILPCLIARSDVKATLFESSKKKAVFLREALKQTGTSATVIAQRFEETVTPQVEFVSCRALERFAQMLPTLIQWAPPESTLLLFGGIRLRERLQESVNFEEIRVPNSDSRFLFVARENPRNHTK